MSDKIILTRDGYEKLKAELDYLIGKKRREIAEDIKKARAFGDLKENAEYHAAKDAQAHNEKRIFDLGERLQRAEILDDSRMAKDVALLGATITLVDLKLAETLQYVLTAAEEANFAENKISVTSPVGKAILGKKVGETVNVKVPAGELKYKITKITR